MDNYAGGQTYQYMDDLRQLDACVPQAASRLPQAMVAVLTPLVWREWDRLLKRHPEQQFRSYIVEGIRTGFRVGFNYNTVLQSATQNMPSASAHPEVIREYLATE